MRVFKPKYLVGKDKDERWQRNQYGTAKCWYVSVRGPGARWWSIKGFTDKSMTIELGRRIERLVAHQANREPPDAGLTAWIETLSPQVRTRLVQVGILDGRRAAATKPLTGHLEDFRRALLAKGVTGRHADLVTGRARRIILGCGFERWSDIEPGKVERFLADLRAASGTKPGISNQTHNFYVAAIQQFCGWMTREERAGESRVARLETLNVRVDRRHDRRALGELQRLLAAADDGPDRCGMTGPERTMLYRLAVETGLRAGELRSLTRSSFDLDADPPTVTVEAAYSKHRREDVLPLRPDTAAGLKAFLAFKAATALAFNMPCRRMIAPMLRADLGAAGIPYRDPSGRVADFHALRHTFITNLARGGVHPLAAQDIGRGIEVTFKFGQRQFRHVRSAVPGLILQPVIHGIPVEAPVPADLLSWQLTFRGQFVERGPGDLQVRRQLPDGHHHVGRRLAHGGVLTPRA